MDNKLFRSTIGSLLYLTTSRLDIMFSVCLCARFQSNPKESHIKGSFNLELFYVIPQEPREGLYISRIVRKETTSTGYLLD